LAQNPKEALAKLEEHARRFPNGTLAQEREVMAIDALLRLGRRADAESRAERFKQTYARSGHVRRIDALLAD
jgi:outer membrane protein assembly factor BamD (BamD/ComL family)